MLRLIIEYCNIEEGELSQTIHSRRKIADGFAEVEARLKGVKAVRALKRRNRQSWLPMYAAEERIEGLPEISSAEVSVSGRLRRLVELMSPQTAIKPEALPWRTLEIPVDVPSRRVSCRDFLIERPTADAA